VFEPKGTTVTQQTQKVPGRVSAGNNHDVVYSGVNEGLNRIVNHGPVIDGQQVLIGHGG
jgi:hypothetical protein